MERPQRALLLQLKKNREYICAIAILHYLRTQGACCMTILHNVLTQSFSGNYESLILNTYE